MPDSEKKWRMYKKAEKGILIDGDKEYIIPMFTDSETATDAYGTWKVSMSAKGATSYSSVNSRECYAVDRNTSTGFSIKGNSTSSSTYYGVDLRLPSNLLICPESITVDSANTSKLLVMGISVNPDTGEKTSKEDVVTVPRSGATTVIPLDGRYYNRLFICGNCISSSSHVTIKEVRFTGKCILRQLPN